MSSSSIMKSEEPPSKKKKTLNPSLPDELLVSSFALVSRLYYPTLSLVSKSFGSIITSPELYKTRSSLGLLESCLYVCLQFPDDPKNPRFFTLCKKPNKTVSSKIEKKKGSSGFVLAAVPIRNAPCTEMSGLLAVGHNLYAICRFTDVALCSNVSFLDCRTHTWLQAPSLRISCTHDPLIHGKLYLPGNYEKIESLKGIEMFDTQTQTWMPSSLGEPQNLEGKIYVVNGEPSDRRGFTLQPKDLALDLVGLNNDLYCIIGEVAYGYNWIDGIFWGSFNGCVKVSGLQGLPKFARYSSVKLVNCGGKLMVLWDKYVRSSVYYKERMIWCAQISLEMRSDDEIWGHVDWCDALLAVPKDYKFLEAIVATV